MDLEEDIKWNAPNYRYKGIDRITFNIMNREGKVKLVIHMGTSIKEDKKAKPVINDSSCIVFWNSNIRGTLSFNGMDDINTKKEVLKKILTEWLEVEVK